MNGFWFSQQRGSGGDHAANAITKPARRIRSAAEIMAIPSQLLLTGTPAEQRVSNANGLMKSAGVKLNGFAIKAAEASAIPIVSFTDYPRLKAAYDGYAEAASVYKEVLMQLEPYSDEAIKVRQLLIDAHKSCIKTIYLAIDALDKAPGKKSSLPFMPWEMRACEAIKEINELAGFGELRKIPELRD